MPLRPVSAGSRWHPRHCRWSVDRLWSCGQVSDSAAAAVLYETDLHRGDATLVLTTCDAFRSPRTPDAHPRRAHAPLLEPRAVGAGDRSARGGTAAVCPRIRRLGRAAVDTAVPARAADRGGPPHYQLRSASP